MQTTNQPQTTNNSMDRDASVQISEVTKPEPMKFELIIDGVEKVCVTENPIKDGQDYWYYAAGRNYDMALKLAAILANLTSSDRWMREDAKKKVRELVKLGQKEKP